jgi:peptide-methionine (S)-S-oxide reductase
MASPLLEFSSIVERALFAGGCFWQVEIDFANLEGVGATQVGYSGGSTPNPNYRQVCSGRTGHAETVLVTYDPAQVSYDELLNAFWRLHDPTTKNRQGPDIGSQYRSAIFTTTSEQFATAMESRARAQIGFNRRIVTEITPAGTFYPAEEYHQRYLVKHGRASCRIPETPLVTVGGLA